jgi:hypothetical protein
VGSRRSPFSLCLHEGDRSGQGRCRRPTDIEGLRSLAVIVVDHTSRRPESNESFVSASINTWVPLIEILR